jgi:hypothetical protein
VFWTAKHGDQADDQAGGSEKPLFSPKVLGAGAMATLDQPVLRTTYVPADMAIFLLIRKKVVLQNKSSLGALKAPQHGATNTLPYLSPFSSSLLHGFWLLHSSQSVLKGN